MRVLVACECSGRVRDAFVRAGHDAWSCDMKPSETAGNHLQGNVLEHLNYGTSLYRWDLMVAHPDCTYLANSGILRLVKGKLGVSNWLARGCPMDQFDVDRWQRCKEGSKFFRQLLDAPIPMIAIENPVMHGYAKHLIGIGDPTQTIQPYQFGDPESKRTCLWLKNLPPLVPTNILPLPECGYWSNQTPGGQNKLGPSPDRKANRARTYHGIANAMAQQWGNIQVEENLFSQTA